MSHEVLADSLNADSLNCIELSDDSDEETSTSKKRRVPTECLNIECRFGEEYLDNVPAFVMTFYKVRKKKGLKVCQSCFEEACSYFTVLLSHCTTFLLACTPVNQFSTFAYFQDLRTKFIKQESIYNTPSSKYTPVLNIDSDEEDLSPDDDGWWPYH